MKVTPSPIVSGNLRKVKWKSVCIPGQTITPEYLGALGIPTYTNIHTASTSNIHRMSRCTTITTNNIREVKHQIYYCNWTKLQVEAP